MNHKEPTVDDWLAAGCPCMMQTVSGTDHHWSCFTDEIPHCGCGSPEDSFEYLLKALKALEVGPKEMDEALGFGRGGESNPGPYWTILYFMDEFEWIEHGSRLPGWITDKGKRAIRLLEGMLKCEREDDTFK